MALKANRITLVLRTCLCSVAMTKEIFGATSQFDNTPFNHSPLLKVNITTQRLAFLRTNYLVMFSNDLAVKWFVLEPVEVVQIYVYTYR